MTQKEKLIWAAGFIDGEGCIGIRHYKSTPTQPKYNQIFIAVANTDPHPLLIFKELFGGNIKEQKTRSEKHRIAWKWQLTSKKAAKVLTLVLPYLNSKQEQAKLAIEFQNRRQTNMARKKLTEEEWLKDDQDREELKKLKRLNYSHVIV